MYNNEYDKSVLFDVGWWSNDHRINQLAKAITPELIYNFRRGYQGYKKRYDAAIKNVLMNLLSCFDLPDVEWVAYSRDKNRYKLSTRYNKLHISYKVLINVIDSMIDAGYVENKKGKYYKNYKRMSRMRATPKLMKLIPSRNGLKARIRKELIQLKDEDKKLIDYCETSFTRSKRRILKRINSTIASASLDICMPDRLEEEFFKNRGFWLNSSMNRLHRPFNVSFDRGGRFYGGWWQLINSHLRSLIRINGEPIVELDYSCLHTRMLYDIEGVPQPRGDMYLVDGSVLDRDICKCLLNCVYNASSKQSAIKAAMYSYNMDRTKPGTVTKREVLRVLEPLMLRHAPVAKYFFSGIGTHLQFVDSCVSERIMITLANQGVVCLPVHDSFIVPARCEYLLGRAMRHEYVNQLGNEPIIDKK